MKDWGVIITNTSGLLNITDLNLPVEDIDENEILVDFTGLNLTQTPVYFSAPRDYLGKKLSSYGGFLNYTIYYAIGSQGTAVSGPDVILKGADTYLTYSNFEQPPPASEFITTLQLVESNFELPTGVPARREHIMEVLRDLQGVYIRATYWTASVTTR